MGSGTTRTSPRQEQERKELEAVLGSGIFAASSNAARLLRFVCERTFEGADTAPSESDIALQALGRRPDFDPRQNSIVRVEAHRVRKRLKEYYEAEGASHPIHIILPAGQYVPQFTQAATETWDPAEDPAKPPRDWINAAVAAGLVILAVLIVMWVTRKPVAAVRVATPAPQPAVATVPAGEAVRILAGRSGGEYVDRTGTRWLPDQYFHGGAVTAVRYYSLALADDPAVYQYCRTGEDFTYDIPLPPGTYEMRLMFAESAEAAPVLGSIGDGSRAFAVTANGVQILPPADGHHLHQMDIFADAGGSNIADVKVFKDVTPAADGKLHLRFVSRKQRALINAIEIVPGLAGKMRPLRWRSSETPYTDQAGKIWQADRYFRGGRLSTFHSVVSGTADPNLFESERFGYFTYQIPVVAGGTYSVTLQFAENFFGTWTPPLSQPRIFNVYANRTPLLRDFDIYHEAGGPLKAISRTFHGIRANAFDKIVLAFEPSTDYAIVNAVEVEDEAR